MSEMINRFNQPEANSEISFLNRRYLESIDEYNQLMPYYEAGIREINARLQTLDRDFEVQHQHTPIHHIQSRIKTLPSAFRKLYKMGLNVSVTSAKKNLHDIAGVRVICCYTEDIQTIAKLLSEQEDIQIIDVKDYINHPKPNGYRSLHLVVDVPIYLTRGKVFVKVEIQIRTVAMDFWATLEHRIRYKSTDQVPQFIVDELKQCADVIARTDERMQQISQELRRLNDSSEEYAWQSKAERSRNG
ncbi:MAG: GTP pyrophosphokinase family protein [Clostridia bacterium]|nr:GTP pyrophosphokinase family protein [Clostridia bacterium]